MLIKSYYVYTYSRRKKKTTTAYLHALAKHAALVYVVRVSKWKIVK